MSGPLDRFKQPYTYRRLSVAPAVKGRAQNTAYGDPVAFYASIQALRGLELQILPEGQRDKQNVRVYTETPLQVIDPTKNQKGDLIQYEGRDYEVQRREDWKPTSFNYFKFIAQLKEADD